MGSLKIIHRVMDYADSFTHQLIVDGECGNTVGYSGIAMYENYRAVIVDYWGHGYLEVFKEIIIPIPFSGDIIKTEVKGRGLKSDRIFLISEESLKEYKYVWLNLKDGSFGNSFTEEVYKKFLQGEMDNSLKDRFRLIKYCCLNVAGFEFNHLMIIK